VCREKTLIKKLLDRKDIRVNTRNKKPLDRIYRMNRISKRTLFKDPVNPVILSKKGFAFIYCFCGIF